MFKKNFTIYDKPFFNFVCEDFLDPKLIYPILNLDLDVKIVPLPKKNGVRTVTNNSRIFLNKKIC